MRGLAMALFLALFLALCGAAGRASAGEPRPGGEAPAAGPTFWRRAGRGAAGAEAPAVYSNLGEVLMADGRLREAAAAHREAIAIASAVPGAGALRLDD